MDKRTEAFVDIYERTEEADEALQKYWTELERVLNDDIREEFKTVYGALGFITQIVIDTLGGVSALLSAQDSIHTEREKS